MMCCNHRAHIVFVGQKCVDDKLKMFRVDFFHNLLHDVISILIADALEYLKTGFRSVLNSEGNCDKCDLAKWYSSGIFT